MSKNIPNKTTKSRTKPQTGDFAVTSGSQEAFSAKQNLTLYRLVYNTKSSMLVVALLFSSFLLQGARSAEASTDILDSASEPIAQTLELPVSVSEDPVPEPASLGDIVFDNESVTETMSDQDDSLAETEADLTDLESDENTEQILNDNSDLTDDVLVSADDNETVNDNSGVANNEFDSVSEVGSTSIEFTEPEYDDESELLSDVFVNFEIATSAEELLANTVVVTESDSAFSFTNDECTRLATGSFYCLKAVDTNEMKDALFANRDTEGDLEIYLVRDGVETQVTNNQVDDAAPYFDINSNTIVWHRLVNDRYQIVAYDVDTGREEYLTDTAENNMEPNRQGKYTVWQRWVHGGWNIVLSDGRTEKLITKSTSHNVAPYIHGSLVVWNRHDQVSERTIEMYDIESETYVSVEDPDGMAVSNPRMVFVYDSLHPNGDVVTRGYDLLSKKFIDLDTLPRQLPDSIPTSDSTGETRALIQNKPSGKSEIEEVTGTSTPNSLGLNNEIGTGLSTSTSSSLASTTELSPENILAPSASSTIDLPPALDLTLVSLGSVVESVSTTTMADIPDLIIDNQTEAVVVPLEIEPFIEPGV